MAVLPVDTHHLSLLTPIHSPRWEASHPPQMKSLCPEQRAVGKEGPQSPSTWACVLPHLEHGWWVPGALCPGSLICTIRTLPVSQSDMRVGHNHIQAPRTVHPQKAHPPLLPCVFLFNPRPPDPWSLTDSIRSSPETGMALASLGKRGGGVCGGEAVFVDKGGCRVGAKAWLQHKATWPWASDHTSLSPESPLSCQAGRSSGWLPAGLKELHEGRKKAGLVTEEVTPTPLALGSPRPLPALLGLPGRCVHASAHKP